MEKKGGNPEDKLDMWGSRRGLNPWRSRAWFHGSPEILTRTNSTNSHPERQLHGPRLYCERPVASSLGSKRGDLPKRRPSCCQLPFRRVPPGATACQQSDQPGDLTNEVREAVEASGVDWNALLEHEPEPGLGNGGLGRLAACFLDSLATLQIPCIGYGIRYEFGIFSQSIRDGEQIETTDKWLYLGNPWESHRPEIAYDVKLGGHTEHFRDQDGRLQVRWVPNRLVRGVAYDTPVLGYKVNTCNTLRLWKAEAAESFDFQAFNVGDYYRAVDEKVYSENLTKVLYPNDEPAQGKQLRLEQQYFFVSCSLQDMLRICSMGRFTADKISRSLCSPVK